ncbi:DUF2591 domain-containing protein [Photorhabdus tasmaniensis]|uniref:Recombinase n=1 Tax=Photorhabdus tasmaniensis TaxID=1004159 RepID=A0ABX0GL53_9GAMM|nr:DUF2591 domain-containing protein [Photorhabdus tasmaniensis]NHB89581.1 recombinase [Photorhabdus tasmaniensis]
MRNKYSELSDFEINKLVLIQQYKESFAEIINIRQRNHVFDYCNDCADAMPIVIKNKISLVYVNDFWSARQYHNACIEVNDKNPLRAAMIVFLMMSEGQEK